ncbi:exosortase A [Salinisphaera sp. Q1T1-3]|uniref:exosortase A n=1 Tax=Salinisphaera sp. Q1T1-3 TaxID=2321229 RepID=UPI001314E33C|nr:exosortase A [Salinisphaera sp. Q1T1-3]
MESSSATEVPYADTPWQRTLHIGFGLCALAMVGLYAGSYIGLAEIWAHTGTFQYAFLIFPICLVLAWSRRAWLARVAARPRPVGLVALFGLLGLWLAGAVAQINIAQHIALVLVWPALVYTFYGPRVAGVLAFALGYLLFAIPFGNFMVGPLQTVTAHFAVAVLKISGVPVLMDGHYIDTPASAWHVAEACSGIKFFVALTAFGVLYAHLFYTRWRRRLAFVVIAMIVPIVANGLRVYFTILIGETFGMHYATGTDHMIFGWQFFGAVLILLFLAGWPWHEAPPSPPTPDRGVAPATKGRALTVGGAALAIIVVPAAWFAASGLLAQRAVAEQAAPPLPARVAGLARQADSGSTTTQLAGAASHQTARYGDPSAALRIDYVTGGVDADITSLLQRLFDPAQWQQVGAGRAMSGPDARIPFTVLSLRDRQTGAVRRLLYVFRVGDEWTASPEHLKRRQALARLGGRAVPTGLLVISGPDSFSSAALAAAGAQSAGVIRDGSR